MYRWIALLALVFAAPLAAQDVSTSFTLGSPTANCIPVATQDGVSSGGQGAVCPNGFFGGAGLQLWLPNDPLIGGGALTIYACNVTLISNTVPVLNHNGPSPPGSLVQGLVCPVEYPWFSTTWSGTLTYDYVSVRQTHCTGGRGGHCVTAWYPAWASGEGTLSSPPAPPPPPQPTVTTLTLDLATSACDASFVCQLAPKDGSVVAAATIDIDNSALTVTYADGSVRTSPLDAVQMIPNGDDGDAYTVYADGTLYDADGNSNQTVAAQFTLTSNDGGPFGVSGGTLAITTTTGP